MRTRAVSWQAGLGRCKSLPVRLGSEKGVWVTDSDSDSWKWEPQHCQGAFPGRSLVWPSFVLQMRIPAKMGGGQRSYTEGWRRLIFSNGFRRSWVEWELASSVLSSWVDTWCVVWDFFPPEAIWWLLGKIQTQIENLFFLRVYSKPVILLTSDVTFWLFWLYSFSRVVN